MAYSLNLRRYSENAYTFSWGRALLDVTPIFWSFDTNLIGIKQVVNNVIETKFTKNNRNIFNSDDTTNLSSILSLYPANCLFVEASRSDNNYGVEKHAIDFLKNIGTYNIDINEPNHDYIKNQNIRNVLGNAITRIHKNQARIPIFHLGGGHIKNIKSKLNNKIKIKVIKLKKSQRNMNRVYKLREITNKKRNLKKKKKIQLSHKRRMTGKINHIKRCNRSYKKYSKKKGVKITKKKCNTK